MANSTGSFTVKTNGQSLIVTATYKGGLAAGTASLYSDAAVSASVSLPNTITADTTYYVATPGSYTISAKQLDGTEIWGKAIDLFGQGQVVSIEPLPSRAQVASDLSAPPHVSTPAGAITETIPRYLPGVDGAVLTSGRLHMTAIWLQAGTVVTSATYKAGATPLSGGTNQWFALYSSALALLRQTPDDTATAWSANVTKTLSFTSTFTTTYSGLHYLGIMVAGTVPTLRGYTMSSTVASETPLINGFADASLTATAPPTAAALTSQTTIPYAYVS